MALHLAVLCTETNFYTIPRRPPNLSHFLVRYTTEIKFEHIFYIDLYLSLVIGVTLKKQTISFLKRVFMNIITAYY